MESAAQSVEQRVEQTATILLSGLRELLAAFSEPPTRPSDLVASCGVNKVFASRLLSSLRESDVLAAIQGVPGPVPLRSFLRTVSRRSLSPKPLVETVEQAVDDFAAMIRTEFGDRSNMDALLGSLIVETQERHETTCRQALYRGTAGIHGISAEVALATMLVRPNLNTPNGCDVLMLNGYVGLRRLRPDAVATFTNYLPNPHRERNIGAFKGDILSSFCRPIGQELRSEVLNDRVTYVLDEGPVGARGAVDHYMSAFIEDSQPRRYHKRRYFGAHVDHASKVLVFDMFLHRDVWPGATPELVVHNTAFKGLHDPLDPGMEQYRVQVAADIVELGAGSRGFRCSDVPNYADMLKHVCDARGWNLDEFRGYRCRQSYPIYGTQTCMLFQPPPPEPSSGAPT